MSATSMTTLVCVASICLAACSGRDPAAPAPTEPGAAPANRGGMHEMTCDVAIERIAARRFIGWRGLPRGCSMERFGVRADETYDRWQHGVDLAGYYMPGVKLAHDEVILFQGARPELEWPALAADLGEPEARLDNFMGTVRLPGSEWVYASRGITVFVTEDRLRLYHIAVYPPMALEEYRAPYRLDLEKQRWPLRRTPVP